MQIATLAAAVVIAGFATYRDIRYRTLPNWLCGVTALLGLALAASALDVELLLMHLAHLSVALAIGMSIFALRWWGGGDAKFYAACAAWFPVSQFFQLVFWISAAGVLVLLVSIAVRHLKGRKVSAADRGVPYGVAIAAGLLITGVAQAA